MSLKQSKMMLADGFPAMPDFGSMEEGEATMADVYETQGIIAHVQKTLKADKAYNEGDKFIYKGVIYAATGSIAKNATIVLSGAGANVEAMDDVQTQLDNAGGGYTAGTGIEISDQNVISCTVTGGASYGTTEAKTGSTYNGKDVYARIINLNPAWAPGSSYAIENNIGYDDILACYIELDEYQTGVKHVGDGVVFYSPTTYFRAHFSSGTFYIYAAGSEITLTSGKVLLLYTKA